MTFLFFLSLNLLQTSPKGAVLVIIDGAGESSWADGNGLEKAETPTLDYLKKNYPYASLIAAQQSVGLIRGEPGSSAVGHQTIGLGRTTPSYYQILEKSLRPNSPDSLAKNKLLRDKIKFAKEKNANIHFHGQCTDSGVFAHTKFLRPMFEAAVAENVSKVYVHCSLMSISRPASTYLQDVEKEAPEGLEVIIGSVHSSETSLDKNRDWDKTAISYQAMINVKYANVSSRKDAEIFLDSFDAPSPSFKPLLLSEDAILKSNDVLVLFNFREDKAFQIAHAFINGLDGYEKVPDNLNVVPLILFDQTLKDTPTILPAIKYLNSLGSWISQKGFRQIRIAEQYKRPHVTIFFSGGILQPLFEGEDRKVDFLSLHDTKAYLNPTMNATLVCDTVINAIQSNLYKLIVVNFANIDATGHCGNATAVKMAIEFVDSKIKQIFDECELNNYALFITADHGNGEENTLLNGNPQVDHTVNNVPFITNLGGYHIKQLTYGKAPFIGNVAASILDVLNIEKPPEMESSILERDFGNIQRSENSRLPFTSCLFFFCLGNFVMLLIFMVGKQALLLTKSLTKRKKYDSRPEALYRMSPPL
ncbi:2,3-bisphosphoglycerate-independent phosphoglycerate mutase [Tritrichomonas foetus]|uniref:phosphoglycerate mutase (2,3-diphosphoglycerate-independent) n=1 Tax=Tritrichomonas foetus TaxID=1144522 RepID=A0A1J4JWV3_9EUKA|nr:2,3-bisphosphoglycerate-independent phosphoglycerate mutase [Tritrichomonas foetus]|eukprot:OHT02936.1 2,3-bisphosphoglycerate-independent phosphoglycerate mutase [Tritrichomonas foetus]